jgi:hypothetical protein
MKLIYKSSKPPSLITNYLTDMNRFVTVHPVITKMKHLQQNNFLVSETLKAGFMSFSFSYPATVKVNEESKVVTMEASVMKLARITMIFTISEYSGGALINEEINFHTWLPIKSILHRLFKKQHNLLFRNIESSLN